MSAWLPQLLADSAFAAAFVTPSNVPEIVTLPVIAKIPVELSHTPTSVPARTNLRAVKSTVILFVPLVITLALPNTADATLVSAAFREGSSNVQKDLSDVYTKREEAFETFQEGISTIFENLGEENRKEEKELKEGLENLSDNPQTWDALAAVDDGVMIDFKNELKAATTEKAYLNQHNQHLHQFWIQCKGRRL